MSDIRRCEHCRAAMAPNTHRRPHPMTGKKVCGHCMNITPPEWTMTANQHVAIQYEGQFEIYDRVRTPDGREGEVSALYPDMPYYGGRTVQVNFGSQPDDEGYYGEDQSERFRGDDLIMLAPSPVRSKPWTGKTGSRHVAHDSGDGAAINHCPFCGSGAVIGGHDGTVECQYCKHFFTVQVQPEFRSMPQTVNGQPYDIPGMPGAGPDAGAAAEQREQDVDDVQPGAAKPEGDKPPPFGKAPADPAAKPDDDGPKKPNPFAAHSMLVTSEGLALPFEAAIQRLALEHADDRDAVLAQVRAQNSAR